MKKSIVLLSILFALSTLSVAATVNETFESGAVDSNWSVSTGSVSVPNWGAVDSTAAVGSWSGELEITSENGLASRFINESAYSDLVFHMRISSSGTGGVPDSHQVRFHNGTDGGSTIGLYAAIRDIEGDWTFNGVEVEEQPATDTWYKIGMRDINYSNNSVGEIRIDGQTVLTDVPFNNDIDSVRRVSIRQAGDSDTATSGETIGYVDNVPVDDTFVSFESFALPNGTVWYRNASIAELDFTTTTRSVGFDDYDLNLMVQRPQYSELQRETTFTNVPDGEITTLYSVNASDQPRSEYPNGEYRYRWYAGDCPETPDCTGSGDTLYAVSDLRTIELRDFDQPAFNEIEPLEGSGEIGFTELFQFYISSQGTGNVSVVVDDDRVVNTTKNSGGSVFFNESHTHSALGGHTWYPRIDVLYNGDTRTFTGDSQTYTLFAESAVNITLVDPGDGDTVQDSYSLITDVDGNVAGEISIVVDGQERTTCPHDGDGLVTCSIDSSELSLSTGEHTWRVFLFTDAGEQFSSTQQTFVKSIEGDQESEIEALFPDDGELFNVVRPIDIGAALESNAGGYLSVKINNETVPHTYNGDLRNETRYSGGNREEFRFTVDNSEFYDGASSYDWRVVFDGDIDQHTNATDNRTFSMLQGIVDYDLIQPESGEVLWTGNSSAVSVVDSFDLEVDLLYRMFSTPNGTVTDDPFLPHIYEHRVFLDGDLVNVVNQSTSGWTTRIKTTSSIEEGEHQWWVETYNISSNNLVDRSPVQEFTINVTPTPETIGQQVLDFILLRDLSFASRFLIGSIIVLTLSTVLSLLIESPLIFFLVMLFGLMFGGSISPPWFPTWLLVLFALLGGAIVYWWVTNN